MEGLAEDTAGELATDDAVAYLSHHISTHPLESQAMTISQLTEAQKGHLIYRLDHNTYCGLLTAIRIAKGEWGDLEIKDIFLQMDRSPRSASILATKVQKFRLPC